MKPLPPAPLTNEDWLILVDHGGVAKNAYVMGWRLAHSRESDRRDAELMLEAQQCAKGNGPSAIEVRGIACRGYNEHGYWIEDTEDGEGGMAAMKPLEALQVTAEDMDIYVRMAGHYRRHGYTVVKLYDTADRRDAVLMRWLSGMRLAHYGRNPQLPPQACIPIVHLCVRIDAQWPAGHLGIDLT